MRSKTRNPSMLLHTRRHGSLKRSGACSPSWTQQICRLGKRNLSLHSASFREDKIFPGISSGGSKEQRASAISTVGPAKSAPHHPSDHRHDRPPATRTTVGHIRFPCAVCNRLVLYSNSTYSLIEKWNVGCIVYIYIFECFIFI